MANSYFRFKQFTIQQDKCAMKVCTDACLFGAWVAERVDSWQLTVNRVLDIGTGTGLLSLMLAQKFSNAWIDAVEIDEASAQQAKENFEASPWSERLNFYHSSIQAFSQNAAHNNLAIKQFSNETIEPYNTSTKYNLIIANPPFFENDLKSLSEKRNLALHSEALSLQELLSSTKKLLVHDGHFALLLPYHRSTYFENLAVANEFYLKQKVLIKQTSAHNYFRSILFFSRQPSAINQSEITIMNNNNQYTKEFIELLADYYFSP
ncbi:MAG: methyltransferase [Parafilimonas sp.]